MQLKSLLPRMREWVNQSINQSTNRSCVLSRRYMVLPSSFPFRFLPNLTLTLLTWTIWRAPTNASKWRIGFNSAFKGLRVLPSHASQDHCLPELRYRLKFPTVFWEIYHFSQSLKKNLSLIIMPVKYIRVWRCKFTHPKSRNCRTLIQTFTFWQLHHKGWSPDSCWMESYVILG